MNSLGLIWGLERLAKAVAERGPRYAVEGTIRRGEYILRYAATADEAEAALERLREDGYYQTRLHNPEGSTDLTKLGRDRANAERALAEATEILKAGVVRAAEEGRNESEIARQSGVTRVTVRSWLGK